MKHYLKLILVFLIAAFFNSNILAEKRAYNAGFTIQDTNYKLGESTKTLSMAVWYPTDELPGWYIYGGTTKGNIANDAKIFGGDVKFPILIFSHGYGGSGLSAVFLMEQLAGRGWIIVCPDHNDDHAAVRSRNGQLKKIDRRGMLASAKKIAQSGPQDRDKYLYRIVEIRQALNWALESELLKDHIDINKIAVGGHSFGGFTALSLCGTIEKWHDKRIKALLLFSSGAGGYLYTEQELASVKIPSVYFFGEKEKENKRGNNTMQKLADKIYGNLNPPKYFYEIKGGNHFSFNNRFSDRRRAKRMSGTEPLFDVIRRYSIAFLEKYINDDNDSGNLLGRQDPLISHSEKEVSVNPGNGL